MAQYKKVGNLKVRTDLSPEKQALVNEIAKNYVQQNKAIDSERRKNIGRGAVGSLVSGASFLPVLNIPGAGAAIGGAMYDLGQGITEGNNAKDLALRAARGAAIGAAIPPAARKLAATKAGQAIGKQLDKAAEKFAQTKAYDALMSEFAPIKAVEKNVVLPAVRKVNAGINPLAKTESKVLYDSANPRHRLQADLINKYNPAPDSYHTWVRNADDIYNFEDTLKPPQFDPDFIGNDFDPSYTWDMAQDAIKNGEMEVYSSYPIEKGTFVTPSTMEAQSYAGNGNIYSKRVPLKDVAWIDERQGQYAPVDIDKAYDKAIEKAKQDDILDLTDLFTSTPTEDEVRATVQDLIANRKIMDTADKNWKMDIQEREDVRGYSTADHLINSDKWNKLNNAQKRRLRKYVKEVEKIINHSKYTNKTSPNTKSFQKPDVDRYHYFETPVKIGDNIYNLLLDAEQYIGDSIKKPQTVHLYNIKEK